MELEDKKGYGFLERCGCILDDESGSIFGGKGSNENIKKFEDLRSEYFKIGGESIVPVDDLHCDMKIEDVRVA